MLRTTLKNATIQLKILKFGALCKPVNSKKDTFNFLHAFIYLRMISVWGHYYLRVAGSIDF